MTLFDRKAKLGCFRILRERSTLVSWVYFQWSDFHVSLRTSKSRLSVKFMIKGFHCFVPVDQTGALCQASFLISGLYKLTFPDDLENLLTEPVVFAPCRLILITRTVKNVTQVGSWFLTRPEFAIYTHTLAVFGNNTPEGSIFRRHSTVIYYR